MLSLLEHAFFLHQDFSFSVLGVIGYTLLLTHITIIAVTVYLHRFSAHRALNLHPLVQHFFRFWLWLTTGMVTRHWTAIHRKHHAKCETPDDPHSPQVLGLRKVLREGAELYQAEAQNEATLAQFGQGTPNDWIEKNLYSKHDKWGVSLMLLINLCLWGPIGLTIWAIQMIWIPLLAAGVINGIGHYWGYRNYEVKDASRNIVPWGILIGGEELHNNHHTYPNSAKLACKKWEFDAGWFYIKLLSLLKLANVNRTPPKAVLDPNKYEIDFDTLKAVIHNRFQVMALYRKTVVSPMVAQAKTTADANGRAVLNKAKTLLSKIPHTLDPKTRLSLEAILNQNPSLDTIYQYKIQLQQIWERTSMSKAEMTEQLSEWCRRAEMTGIQALEEFSLSLRRYTLNA